MTYVYQGTQRYSEPNPATCREARGKLTGYKRHRSAMEYPCDKCRAAYNAYQRKWAKGRGYSQTKRQLELARRRAYAALGRRHKAEYEALRRAELFKIVNGE